MLRPPSLFSVTAVAAGDPAGLACAVPHRVAEVASEDDEARSACDVAEAADRRPRGLGLPIRDKVRIEIAVVLDVAPGVCLALCSKKARKRQALPAGRLDDQPGQAKAFPWASAAGLFESPIVHELVLACLDQAAVRLSRRSHEYLACAVRLDALAAEARTRVTGRVHVAVPVDPGTINEALLSLSPLCFAATSRLHFRQQGGDGSVVRRVLERIALVPECPGTGGS